MNYSALKRWRSKSLPVIGAIALLCGCASPAIHQQSRPLPDNISVVDESLSTQLESAGPVTSSRDAWGLLHEDIPVRAKSTVATYIEYRATFLDADGIELHTTPWKAQTLPPNTPTHIQFSSFTPRAADFRMEIRYIR